MVMLQRSRLSLYEEYFTRRDFERTAMLLALAARFEVRKVLYPGSFVHVTPSFVWPEVTYVDTDRRCRGFFADTAVLRLVEQRKAYPGKPAMAFVQCDYSRDLPMPRSSFDLLISQYAGPVSQACKQHLRPGGLLLVNDSHCDATMAYLDPDYRLVAAIEGRGDGASLSDEALERYFQPRNQVQPTVSEMQRLGRPPAYMYKAASYVFERVG